MERFSLNSPLVYAVTTVAVCAGSILYAKRKIERKQRELEEIFLQQKRAENYNLGATEKSKIDESNGGKQDEIEVR